MADQQMVEVQDLSFQYENRSVLKNVSFSLRKGEIATLIGASGSGKTTLFKLLTGMLKPKQGTIAIDQQPLPAGHGNVAYMMQEDLLLPWRTVIDNMMLMTEFGPHRFCKQTVLDEAHHMLREMEMAGSAHLFPHQLSGGMRQRIALARALLHKRPLLLLDEPFASLDVILREQMYALLKQTRSKRETTMLLVTHDFRDALALSDHILLLANQGISHEWHISDAIRHDIHASNTLLNEMRTALGNCNSIERNIHGC